MCLMAAFVPHRANKYFHVTASNGIVSSSPYTPLAIMTALHLRSHRFGYSKLSAMQMSDRYVRCAPIVPSIAGTAMPLAAAPYRASGLVLWHETDMPTALRDVRSQGAKRKIY